MAYDPKITIKKFLMGFGWAVLGTFITYTINFLEITEFPPEYVVIVGFLLALGRASENWYKHRSD